MHGPSLCLHDCYSVRTIFLIICRTVTLLFLILCIEGRHNYRLQSTKQISLYEAKETAKMRVAFFLDTCKVWPQGHDSLRSDLSFHGLPASMHPRIITAR